MSLVDSLQPGVRLYDRATGQVRTLHHVEVYASVVYLSFLNALTGGVSREPFPRAELESRFEVATGEAAFRGNPETVRRMADTVCSAAKPGGLSGLAE